METTENESNQKRRPVIFTVVQKRRIIQEIEKEEITIEQAIEKYGIGAKKTLMTWVPIYAQDPSKFIKSRYYTEATRRQAAMLIESSKLSIREASKQYSVREDTIRLWLAEKSKATKIEVAVNAPATDEVQALRLRIQALEAMIDLAEQEYNIPIRKKCGTKQ